MKFIINLTTFDPAIGEILNKLGRKRGQFIEKALDDFSNTKKGKDVYQMMTSEESGEELKPEPVPTPAKRKAPKPKKQETRQVREQEPQEPQEQEQAGGKIDLDSFL